MRNVRQHKSDRTSCEPVPVVQSVFYDSVAHLYTLMFESWDLILDDTVRILADALPKTVKRREAKKILAPMGGPGTEAIAAARLGYTVTSCDLSPEMVRFAAEVATGRNLRIQFGVADVRQLPQSLKQNDFDGAVVLGNSVCCMLTFDDLVRSFKEIRAALKDNAPFVLSVRAYADELIGQCRKTSVIDQPWRCADGRLIYETWEFDDARCAVYDCTLHIEQQGKSLIHQLAVCRAWGLDEINDALSQAGFVTSRWVDNRSQQSVYATGLDQHIAIAKAMPQPIHSSG